MLNELNNKPEDTVKILGEKQPVVAQPPQSENRAKEEVEDDGFADEIDIPSDVLTEPIVPIESKKNLGDTMFKEWQTAKTLQGQMDEVTETQDLNLESSEKLNFWLWDIWEDPQENRGQLFLFGKLEHNGMYSSVCIQIMDIQNRLYLLPRAKVILID